LRVGVKRLEPVPRSQSNRNFVGGDLVEECKADAGIIAFIVPERLSEKVGLGSRCKTGNYLRMTGRYLRMAELSL